ncbi:MAG: aminopeptidase P family N-terminal domain-containing protein, partial [Rhodospirillales bacterium]|nr:aminopeptidase P family N-terminal domain-containing protein [Rhodospirillales bacterium]
MNTPVSFDPTLLARLRQRLTALGLDGFLVPHANAHQSEYLPASDERLARLTGFSGSAGFAIVLKDSAALFVDGRYTLQAANEVDAGTFEIVASAKTRPSAWLKDRLRPRNKIGFDPWLHTPKDLESFAEVCRNTEAELLSVDLNPIDAEWPDRPA